jgi:hypothetical protein
MTAIERKLDKLLIAANDPQRTPAERRFAYQRATELMTALLVSRSSMRGRVGGRNEFLPVDCPDHFRTGDDCVVQTSSTEIAALTPFKRAVCMIGPCALAVLVLALWWK